MQPFPTNLAEIYRLIDDRSTFDRGKRYAHEGRVKLAAPPEGDGSENSRRRWECSVLGSKEYRVILQQHRDDLDIMWCSCPAFVRNGVCKHIAAALTYLVE
ncbi:MAG: SWIM zinc finger family protein, partial [Kyrpidia tusciae]